MLCQISFGMRRVQEMEDVRDPLLLLEERPLEDIVSPSSRSEYCREALRLDSSDRSSTDSLTSPSSRLGGARMVIFFDCGGLMNVAWEVC